MTTDASAKAGSRWANVALLAISLSIGVIACEAAFRMRYAHYFYAPDDAVRRVQAHMRLDPDLGFIWQPGVPYQEAIVLEPDTRAFAALRTDAAGFLNHPGAIETAAIRAPDVIGLGDSFMELACAAFYERFAADRTFYYSMAVNRQCPPQYNHILMRHALPLRPKVVLYGLYENDFSEIRDYLDWRDSGLDWFAYHSGTWCGPPRGAGRARRLLNTHLRGFRALGWVLAEKYAGHIAAPKAGPPPVDAATAARYIVEARDACARHDTRFVLLIIPGKTTTLRGPTRESALCDTARAIAVAQGVESIDLRGAFGRAEDPAALFFPTDGHWNEAGARFAADYVARHMPTFFPE